MINYLHEEYKRLFIKDTLLSIFSEMRQGIWKYYYRKYITEPFVKQVNENFTDFSIVSLDEAIFAIEKIYNNEDKNYKNEEDDASNKFNKAGIKLEKKEDKKKEKNN